jgi:dTDP-4-amino-4,6-dideoxygalactose transaminase
MIPFNKPYITGKETKYITDAVKRGHISGNGIYTKYCQNFFIKKWGFKGCFLTTSCTDALEMAAILANIQPGDEVIVPSFTFVSTALSFIRQGAVIKFVDSRKNHPGMDENQIESLITKKTRAIIPVHYAGVACDMDIIINIAKKYKLLVIEDAAQAIDSYYKGKALGTIGHISCFSFHETKNIQCGEGGMLCINDESLLHRAEIIWEKGTNRAKFFRGEIDKYGWVDTGSSFLPADYVAGFLYAQLEQIYDIQKKRKEIWNLYYKLFSSLRSKINIDLPYIPEYATNNAHMFYIIMPSLNERTNFIKLLKQHNIHPVFHYQSLHKSPYYKDKYLGNELINSDKYSDRLVRMPFFYELNIESLIEIINSII